VAAGAVASESWLARGAERAPVATRRWRVALVAAVILLPVPLVPVALPLIPRAQLPHSWVAHLQHDYGEMIGWPELAAQVERIFESLPPEDRARAVVQTVNYGEAAAIEHFGKLARSQMPLFSGHNNYAFWRNPNDPPEVVLIVGPRHRDWVDRAYFNVEQVGTIENDLHMDNDERGRAIYLCHRLRDPAAGWAAGSYFE
jgi:hypothetical protein